MPNRINLEVTSGNSPQPAPPSRVRAVLLSLLYAFGAAFFGLMLFPLIHWWAIPAGVAVLLLILKLPVLNPNGRG